MYIHLLLFINCQIYVSPSLPSQAAPYTGQFFDANERQRLTGLVDYQAQEVEALKEEIQMLQLKGSHVLPPMQPPVPTGAHR